MSKKKYGMVIVFSFLIMCGLWALCAFVLFPSTFLADSVMGIIMLIIIVFQLIKNYKKYVKQ